ncbi:uncharacterized protein MYCFIDRAFT_202723 [Pseudocercospora fijiensis CIRAD86]|uniref:Uncharacterized protein n=1 Tax=Pseudocercospora fijiensis (strain CIRAD86) TaxID=383855 RepID=M2ZAX3_PSEFD|nr:uncharacterized protein MYCFIDRAFT_202723 [Pseudocercospora fijiensis CIRAD86]EME86995.1 hypothetical protein MYCFIDRAFT_202723 [Pseudocercospora fijiensis CIRAD86]
MISNFPGWRPIPIVSRHGSRRGERAESMQYMRKRYFPTEQLVPEYRTMLYLGRALIDIKRLEAGWSPDSVNFTPLTDSNDPGTQKLAQNLKRLVGTERQIRANAPRTVEAVESIPRVDRDRLQRRVLWGEDWRRRIPSRQKNEFTRRVTRERRAERQARDHDEDDATQANKEGFR